MTTGEKIKKLRQLKGMTLEQLGDKIGVGKSTVRRWEEGQIKHISGANIAKLAIALRCSSNYLLGSQEEPTMTFDVALTNDEQNLIIEYRNADDVAKDAVRRLLSYKGKNNE